jgi:hypothetical protein
MKFENSDNKAYKNAGLLGKGVALVKEKGS